MQPTIMQMEIKGLKNKLWVKSSKFATNFQGIKQENSKKILASKLG
jgi:hypothetical protein